MQQLLTQLWTAIEPSLAQALKAGIAVLVPAVTLYVRTWCQRKIADAAVQRSESTGLTGPGKKALAISALRNAHPLVRPWTATRAAAVVQKAHGRMEDADGMRTTRPETPNSKAASDGDTEKTQ